jgi:hypothetical protein
MPAPRNEGTTLFRPNLRDTHTYYQGRFSLVPRGILLPCLMWALVGCGGGSSNLAPPPPAANPVPTVASISPSSGIAGGAAFTLTVDGSNFISTSTVQWNGTNRTTSYVSATQLTASITTVDIATAGTANVTVVNPAPGGGTSSSASFTANDPVPAISSLSPSSASTGGATFTLTVNGSNFVSSSTVQWNGSSRTTAHVSATQLTASITAADVAGAGTASVTVVNPAPGGGTSPAASLAINDPVPSVGSLSPTNTNAGGAAFTLTVNGSNFISTSMVLWNGSSYSTSYVSATQLTAAVTAASIATAGTASVTVVNPAPGGGTSPAASFTINGAIPGNVSFVSPNGSDSNPGTITLPYLTIQKCATTVANGGTCELRAGTYRETVTPNSGITITSYDGESATVDGSDRVTGWTLYQGSIYKASVTLSPDDTNQIFVGNQMMTEARWPNGDDLFHVNWATAQAGTTTTQIVDSNLPNINWAGAKIHLWSGSDPYSSLTGSVSASGSSQITIAPDSIANCPGICPTVGGYYYLFGILGALDTQREWFYDSSANTLYFWAPGGVNPDTLDVRAKRRQYAFDLSGKSSVTIQNINIFASTINSDFSSTNNVLDGINAQYVSQFTSLPDPPGFPGGYVADHMGTSGIIINGTGNTLRNSTIAYSAGNGVVLITGNNVVKNNLIHHINYIGIDLAGIAVLGSSNPPQNSTIQNNTIHTLGRQAILIQYWTGNIQNADISYNNLFNAMTFTRDGGEIYACCNQLVATGTRIHHNWIHDTQSLIPGAANNYPASGVYIDNGSAGFEVDQNVMWNNQYENILLHGNGVTTPNDNNVHNNSIPDINNSAYIWLFQIPNCGTTRVVDNLVLVPVNNVGNDPACTVTNNSSTAPGATEMNSSVQVGCNFAGCSSSEPPGILGSSVAASIAVEPLSVTVTAGQMATFTVRAAGSPTLSYQWQRNGANVTGATTASYTTPPTTAADDGSVFTVKVTNSVGSATSNPAALTVK